jgi:hypothetical protein
MSNMKPCNITSRSLIIAQTSMSVYLLTVLIRYLIWDTLIYNLYQFLMCNRCVAILHIVLNVERNSILYYSIPPIHTHTHFINTNWQNTWSVSFGRKWLFDGQLHLLNGKAQAEPFKRPICPSRTSSSSFIIPYLVGFLEISIMSSWKKRYINRYKYTLYRDVNFALEWIYR